jgi:hypothetical protein
MNSVIRRRLRIIGEHSPGVHVEGGEQRQRAVTEVFVFDTHRRMAGSGWADPVTAFTGLDGGLGVDGDDPVTRPERFTLIKALVEVEDHGRLGCEIGVAPEDPRLVSPGFDRVLDQDPPNTPKRRFSAADRG